MIIHMDSMTAKAYIKCQGGARTKFLNSEELQMLIWVENRLASIREVHVTSVSNVVADWLNQRKLDQT